MKTNNGPGLKVAAVLGALALNLIACSFSPNEVSPEPQKEILSAKDSRLKCERDKDCVITCNPDKTCCGELCECSDVINISTHREVVQWSKVNCGDVECPVADCDVPEFDHRAVCIQGLCADEKTPWKGPQ